MFCPNNVDSLPEFMSTNCPNWGGAAAPCPPLSRTPMPQVAVDKEALICLSSVYSYYFKRNFPLFYVYPALTRYLYILFFNILTLLACTHSSDNLFHTLMVLCENENFLTSNLLCFFTRVKLCPLVILLK